MANLVRPETFFKVFRKLMWPAVIFTALFSVTAYTSYVRITKNFYEVDPGRFYRSAQLTPDELKEAIEKYGIKTVISLRGAPENAYWYKPQMDVLRSKGVAFKSYWLLPDRFPDRDELTNILADLRNAPKPILVHCRSGADRTGLVSALYAYEIMKEPKAVALEQLSFRYWHVPLLHPAMDAFVERYEGPSWVESYDPCQYPEFGDKSANCEGHEKGKL